jgi:nucleoside-diphosphate-sugar epimerase
MNDGNTVLVLGATGGIGGEVARQLRDRGWNVRALQRRAAHNALQPRTAPIAPQRRAAPIAAQAGMTWIRGDAMNADDVRAAAEGCSVIVHAVNPPGYRRWPELVLPMLDNTIAAARLTGATIVLPGNVYNFGPDALPLLTEDAPQHPVTRKGAIRVEMERRLFAASTQGARVLIVRAGDFFGPGAGSTWFAQGLVKAGRPVTAVSNPCRPGVGHQWAYLPDVARTMAELLERRDSLPAFATFHMAGHWDADGSQIARSIQRVVTRRTGKEPRLTGFPWWLVSLASPFVTMCREMGEMRYLWREPVQLDNSRLKALLCREPHTPLDEAVEATLAGLGCIAAPDGLGGAARSVGLSG